MGRLWSKKKSAPKDQEPTSSIDSDVTAAQAGTAAQTQTQQHISTQPEPQKTEQSAQKDQGRAPAVQTLTPKAQHGIDADPSETVRPVDPAMENITMNTTFRLPYDRSGEPGSASGAPTVIRAGLHLDGNIRTGDDILLEGSVRGEVIANSITVAAGATLSGTVSAAVIVVDGTVEGVVRCIKLQVNTTGAVSGEIHHSVLVVEAGAAIEGTVFRTERHNDAPAIAVAVSAAPPAASTADASDEVAPTVA